MIFVALIGSLLCQPGCQGFSIGPRDGLFGLPVEFSKREKKPKQSIDEMHESLLAENRQSTAAGRLTGESIGQSAARSNTGSATGTAGAWWDAADAPSAEEWYANAGGATMPQSAGDLPEQNQPRPLQRQVDQVPEMFAQQDKASHNEIMQASYVPREINAHDANNASRGVTNAAMVSDSMSNDGAGVVPAYHGEQMAALNIPAPLIQDNWVANLEWERFRNGKTDQKPESSWRWRHRGIEEILILPPDRQPNWQALLRHDDPIVRGNVLITLARMGDQRVGLALIGLANDVSRSRSMRCAAVEALGTLESTSPETLLQLADTYYDYVDANGQRKGGIAELAVEILYVLPTKMPLSNEPHFTRPLESRDAKVRLTAVCLWRDNAPMQGQGAAALPEIVVYYCGDSNTAIQEAALTAVARWRHPHAMQCLDLGLRSPKATVRCAAIQGLAELRTNEATAHLLSLVNDQSSAIRAEVVMALGRLGLLDNVYQMSDDPAWEVRKAVASELAKSDNPKTRMIAQKYLHDPSTQVQTTMLESLRQWHPESTATLLFEAMGGNASETRNLATDMLAKYWEPARQYVPNARPETRKQQYQQLSQQLQHDMQNGTLQANIARILNGDAPQRLAQQQPQQQVGPLSPGSLTHRQSTQGQQITITPMPTGRAAVTQDANDGRVRTLLTQLQQPGTQQQHQATVAELINMGPAIMPTLEQIGVAEGRSLPPVVYQRVLPTLDPLFEISAKLENNAPGARRAAVAELVGETKFGDVSPLLYQQLGDHAIRENDEIVLQRLWDFADQHAEKLTQLDIEWQGNLAQNVASQQYQKALAQSLHVFRGKLASASTAQPSPELRRRMCLHLKEHGQPENVPMLLAEINHPSTSVSRTALQALAKLGSIECSSQVRPLVTHSQPLVAVDAALALDRWGDAIGTNALERLAVSGDRTTKLAVVQGVRQNVDRKYVPMLIRLLDESGTIRQEALDALPLAVGHDIVPPQEMAYYSMQERVALWKQWNNDGQVF